MARRKYYIDEKRIARYTKEGRGKGEGADYKPWIRADEVPSLGRVHRVFCSKTGRVHHFLSDNEYMAFLHFYWDDSVVDIREQFPFPDRETTKAIARSLKIKYPMDPSTQTPIVITTDFLVTFIVNEQKVISAFAVKQAGDLEIQRVREKLEIERIYCEEVLGIEWKLVTNIQVKTTFAKNLDWLSNEHTKAVMSEVTLETLQRLISWFIEASSKNLKIPVSLYCRRFDIENELKSGMGLAITRYLLGAKILETNLHSRRIQEQPATSFRINNHKLLEFTCAAI